MALACLVVGAVACRGQTLTSETAAPSATASAASLAWIEGHWVNADTGAMELWSASGDAVIGFAFAPRADGSPSVEFLRMTTEALVAAPRGQGVTTFRATDRGPLWTLFENRTHDFPKWVRYERDGARLSAAIGDEPTNSKATNAKATWSYTLAAPQPRRQDLDVTICASDGEVRIDLGPCSSCDGALYCAELGGELVVGLTDRNCDGCTETSGVCHTPVATPAASGCEPKRVSAFVLTDDS